ncbi:oligosaccharide flippase family protein [Roseateles sp. DC23W]|uniref:Oligosaccharide flippase family protein n=1 Tax=Pelomonas dachongensis TaxID=3299029 RepID=A0ABW7ESS2_9BURK
MSTRLALLFSFLDRYSGLVLAVASSMIIARLLTPADIGVFSVASALLLMANAVRDMGAGQYLVQTKQLGDEQIKAVWTLQTGMGLALGLLVAALAVPAAHFYSEPRMTPVMLVMAVSFVVNPVGAITYAMLMRHMRFQHVAIMRFSASLVGAVVAVATAYQGHGPLSLALGALASTVTNAVASQFFRARETPWGFSVARLPEVLSFGGRIAGTQVVNSVLMATPDFVLGKLQSVHAAGMYSRSNGLVSMFNRLVTDAVFNVAVALFSEQNRSGKPVKAGMLRALSYVTVLNWVFAVNLICLAHPVTVALYGHQWDESVALTRLLAVAGALVAPVPICIAITTALGRADQIFRISLLLGVLTAMATLAGASLGLLPMGLAICAASGVACVVWLWLTSSLVGCGLKPMLHTLARSALVAGLCATLPAVLVLTLGAQPASPWIVLLIATFGGLALLLVALVLTRHPLAHEILPLLHRAQRRALPWR